METKDIVGLLLLVVATLSVFAALCCSQLARDGVFLVMVATIILGDRLDINFYSHWWYRGTTRGVEISLGEVLAAALLASSLLLPRYGGSRWRWPAGFGFMFLFFLYAAGSVFFIEPREFGVLELSKMLGGLIFFLAVATFVRSDREIAIFVLAICCAACFEGLLCLRQRWMMHMDRVAGTLDHPNSLSVYLCLIGPILVAGLNSTLPRWVRWACAAAVSAAALSSVLTVSRAGVPTFFLCVFAAALSTMSWRITVKKIVIALTVMLGLCALGFCFWGNLKDRYEEATFEEEYLDKNAVENRGYYIRLAAAIVEDRFFGVGLNNWSYWVSEKYGAVVNTPFAYNSYNEIPEDQKEDGDFIMSFAAPAHSLAALTVGELGVPGLVLFSLMWLRWFQMGAAFYFMRSRTAVRALGIGILWGTIGVFLQSITEWSFRHTPVFMTFHTAAGVLAALYCLRRAPRCETEEEAEESPDYLEDELQPAAT